MLTCKSIAWKTVSCFLLNQLVTTFVLAKPTKCLADKWIHPLYLHFKGNISRCLLSWSIGVSASPVKWHKASWNITIRIQGTWVSRPTPWNITISTQCWASRTPSWLAQQPSDTHFPGKASQRNTPRSRAHEQIIDIVCPLTRPALACAGTVAKSSDSSGLSCLGVWTNKCLLLLILKQGLVGVSISNVTASFTELLVRGDMSHSFLHIPDKSKTHHCG